MRARSHMWFAGVLNAAPGYLTPWQTTVQDSVRQCKAVSVIRIEQNC